VYLKTIFDKAKREKRKNLLEHEVYQILNFYRIPTPKWKLVKSKKEAVEFAEKSKYPVVLKVVSKEIIHKSDVGGVFVDLPDKIAVERAYDQITKNVRKNVPRAKIEGVLVYKMIQKGKEVIIGGMKDPQFGQTIMFGSGGILVEFIRDTVFRVLPITRKNAEEMIDESKISNLLRSYRGTSSDVNEIINTIMKVGKLLEDNPQIKEFEMNPIEVLKKGLCPVDARIILE